MPLKELKCRRWLLSAQTIPCSCGCCSMCLPAHVPENDAVEEIQVGVSLAETGTVAQTPPAVLGMWPRALRGESSSTEGGIPSRPRFPTPAPHFSPGLVKPLCRSAGTWAEQSHGWGSCRTRWAQSCSFTSHLTLPGYRLPM